MEWYWWVALAVLLVALLGVLGLRLFRASRRGRRFLALSARGKLRFGRELLADPEVSLVAKVDLLLLVGYLALPFDLIPDFIPVVGQLDDALVVMVAVGLLLLAVPRRQFDAALARAEAAQEAHRAARGKARGMGHGT